MDIKKVRKSLELFASEIQTTGNYRLLEFSVCEGKTPWKKKHEALIVPNKDFSIGDKTMFTSEEAFTLQDNGKDFGLRLLRAHEWRGLGFWITYGGEYVHKFNLEHAGHTWESTDIVQDKDRAAYYWTGSSDKAREFVRAARIFPDGTFDINFRSPEEAMRVRLILDPELLKRG